MLKRRVLDELVLFIVFKRKICGAHDLLGGVVVRTFAS
jgi:hypothetical protein